MNYNTSVMVRVKYHGTTRWKETWSLHSILGKKNRNTQKAKKNKRGNSTKLVTVLLLISYLGL
jgi:hypothetical protein